MELTGPAMDDASRRRLVERIHASPTMLVLSVTGGGVAAITDLLAVPGASRTVLEVVVPYAESALAELVAGAHAGGPAAGLRPAGAASVTTAGEMPPAPGDAGVASARAADEMASARGDAGTVSAGTVGEMASAGGDAGAVSAATAEAMALAGLTRARRLAPGQRDLIGVACTAALASDRPKRGAHRAHLAVVRAGAGPGGAVQILQERADLEKGRRDRAGEDRLVADHLLQLIAQACGIAPLG